MPFIIAAHRELANLNPGTPNHSILNYLINNALGAANAKSWDAIEAHCNQNQVVVDKQAFQQGFWQRRATATYSLDHVQEVIS